MKRRISALLTAGVLVAGVGAAQASAVKYPTRFVQFKLQKSSDKRTFSGQIDAPTSKCVKGRTVEVIRMHNGNQQVLKKNGTNSNGKFSITFSNGELKNGAYYAKVKVKKYDNDQKVCESAQSGSIKLS